MPDIPLRSAIIVLCIIFAVVDAGSAAGDAIEKPAISFHQPSSAVFAETESEWHVDVADRAARSGVVAWRYSANNRTIARGESPVEPQPDGPPLSKIAVPIPPIREGIVLETRLTASLVGGDARLTIEQPVWVFPC